MTGTLDTPPREPRLLDHLPIDLFPADQSLGRAAAEAFCVATAQRLDAVVLTNDPEFEWVEKLIKIRWLTKRNHRR